MSQEEQHTVQWIDQTCHILVLVPWPSSRAMLVGWQHCQLVEFCESQFFSPFGPKAHLLAKSREDRAVNNVRRAWRKTTLYIYCDMPGSPCLSKTGPVYGPFFFLGLVHLWTDQRIPGPVSCRCPEPRWFVGDPTPLARDNMMSAC